MNMRNTDCPKPGIYPGVPWPEYAGWEALNNTGIGRLLRSPAHYQADCLADDDTKAKTRGSVCHAGIWEPQRFAAEYAIGPCVKLNTKAGKDEWEAFVAANPGKAHVRGEHGAAMLGCRRAIWAHPTARRLLGDRGPAEVSVVWDDAETGCRCKARVDKLAEAFSFVVDLKTAGDARPEAFERAVGEYQYHRQAAWYLHGLGALGMAFDNFAVIAVETDPPYAVNVFEMDHDDMTLGWQDCREAMRLYVDCLVTGDWPCYSTDPLPVGLPRWKRQRVLEAAI